MHDEPQSAEMTDSERWMRQAELDWAMAQTAAAAGRHEWACFCCQQAGEKALKAVLYAQGRTSAVQTHSLTDLVRACGRIDPLFKQLRSAAKALDRHYLPARYPDAINAGDAPGDFYSADDFERSLQCLESILTACRSFLGGSSGSSRS